jgi:hypothetical protein
MVLQAGTKTLLCGVGFGLRFVASATLAFYVENHPETIQEQIDDVAL